MRKMDERPTSKLIQRLSTAILLLAVAVSLSLILFTLMTPDTPVTYTGFYVLGMDRTTETYPSNITLGNLNSVILGIQNEEGVDQTYVIETYALQETKIPEIYPPIIYQMVLLDRWDVPVPKDQTQEMAYTFVIDNQTLNKLVFLLFSGEVPPENLTGQDRIEASYRHLQLWINATMNGSELQSSGNGDMDNLTV